MGAARGENSRPAPCLSGSMESSEIDSTWYALRVFHCREERVEDYLRARGWQTFLPRRPVSRAAGGESPVLAPAVHGLLFVDCPAGGEAALRGVLAACPHALQVYRRADGRSWAPISSREMADVRAVCDAALDGTRYVPADELPARRGVPVRVVRGPLAGVEGRLMRYQRRTYVVLLVASLGVLVHVPKWCCRPLVPPNPAHSPCGEQNESY